MCGPAEDQLEESKESGFELREMFKKKQEKLEKAMMGEEDSDEEEKEEKGVTWGFAEDAWEDDDKDDDLLPDASKKANFLKVFYKGEFLVTFYKLSFVEKNRFFVIF